MGKFKQIAYVSINVKGTNIFVNITKKDESQNSDEYIILLIIVIL